MRAPLTAQIPTEALVATAAATAVRNQQVTESTTSAGIEAHAATIAACAPEKEAAQAVQEAAGAMLTVSHAAIAEADATPSTT